MFMCDVILFTVNYCLFANGDVSFRFNGKVDNVVLELYLKDFCLISHHHLVLKYEIRLAISSLIRRTNLNTRRRYIVKI